MSHVSHIDHIAIAIKNMEGAKSFFAALGLLPIHEEELIDRGIRVVFFKLGETKIEVMEPTREDSEISKFLQEKGPGIHHIAFHTKNIQRLTETLKDGSIKMIYEKARPGAHECLVNFAHPKSTGGFLAEIVEKNEKS